MAVAARPGPSDARVPCPLCGGLIHPIAGKCKHCKADLSTYHAARPAASTPLPALLRVQPALPAAVAAVALPEREPRAVLPPRPTGRVRAPAARSAGWRSWPVLVIIVATCAIVVAAVLMVWPPAKQDPGKRAVPTPAPERMDTQNPGAAPIDPWSAPRAAPPTPTPARPAPTPAPADPDPRPDPPQAEADPDPDPGATTQTAPRLRNRLPTSGRGMVMLAMAEHLCRKMAECGSDDLMTKGMCDTVLRSATDIPPNCPSATRCLDHIDQMSCAAQSEDLSQLGSLLTQFRDCAEAVRC
jgi:hypothetical protein